MGDNRILTPAMHGNPMGRIAVKEKIVDVHIAEEASSGFLEESVRHMIEEGFQPVPQTYSVKSDSRMFTGLSYSMVLIKTAFKEEML